MIHATEVERDGDEGGGKRDEGGEGVEGGGHQRKEATSRVIALHTAGLSPAAGTH